MTTDTRTPEDVARAVSRETGWDLDAWTEEHEWTSTGLGPVGQHRDSDPLDRSNFTVIYDDLSTRFPDSVDVVRFGHWAVGWVEEIAYDTGSEVSEAVARWRDRLDSYPVADEEHFSELEWETDHPGDGLCYSEDPDCGCGSERA